MYLLLLALLGVSSERVYEATLVDCYDGDTCTFDVRLNRDARGDWGLGIKDAQALPVFLMYPNTQPSMLVRTQQHVRLCDINAPELHPGNPPEAVKARDDLVSWMIGKKVHLHVPQNSHGDMYEKFGRLLVHIYVGDENLNEKQLKTGNAKPFIRCK